MSSETSGWSRHGDDMSPSPPWLRSRCISWQKHAQFPTQSDTPQRKALAVSVDTEILPLRGFYTVTCQRCYHMTEMKVQSRSSACSTLQAQFKLADADGEGLPYPQP